MTLPHRLAVLGLLFFFCANLLFASAYNAHPRLIVVVVIDQFRGDYLERYRDQFGEGGFKLFLDHGANFTDCTYNYANTATAPGHATLMTGAYSNGHGIMANSWWDPQRKRMVTAVFDEATKLVGIPGDNTGMSPHNLLATTLGDELKLATQGKSRVFGISMKDRSAILAAGFAANGAYWVDGKTGTWVTSTYYRDALPKWVQDFNDSKRADKYWNREWKDGNGTVLRITKPGGKPDFFGIVGSTPYGNDYEFEFAREAITAEKLGQGPTTDLLTISLSANDILGHEVGPDAPEVQAMALALDRQLADFFNFLGQQVGLSNVWLALSADHGVSAVPAVALKLHIPALGLDDEKRRAQVNDTLSMTLGKRADYVRVLNYPVVWLDQDLFPADMKEEDAERAVGEAWVHLGMRGYYSRSQLARGEVPNSEQGAQYRHSYSAYGGWYVIGIPAPYTIGSEKGTDHAGPYMYDRHVPLAFYGAPFRPDTYRSHAEPVDLAVTLASLLGINAPSHAIGRVLTEALAPRHAEMATPLSPAHDEVIPVVLSQSGGTR
jgi:predicted AlkP superfamily pyrophosphatase or phosphodiesterase